MNVSMSDCNDIVQLCEMKNVEQESRKNPNGAILVFTNEVTELHLLEEVEKLGEDITILDAGMQDEQCGNLAEKFQVSETPTVIFFKNGKQKGKVTLTGKSNEEIQRELSRLVGSKLKSLTRILKR